MEDRRPRRQYPKNCHPDWKEKFRQNCLKRVQNDRANLIWKVRSTEKPATNPKHIYFQCNICFEVACDPVLTSCSHMYCWPCIYNWMHSKCSARNRCPVCRREVKEANVIAYPFGIPCQGVSPDGQEQFIRSGLQVPQRPQALAINNIWDEKSRCVRLFLLRVLDQHLTDFFDYLKSFLDQRLKDFFNYQKSFLDQLQTDFIDYWKSFLDQLGTDLIDSWRSFLDQLQTDFIDCWKSFPNNLRRRSAQEDKIERR